MKTKVRANASLAHVAKLIEDIPIAMLTTVEADGALASRPMAVLIERLWTAFAKPWFPDGLESPNLALLKFVTEAADYRDAPNNKMVRAVGVIVSMVAGKPIAMGEHGSHTGLSSGALAAGVQS